MAENKAQVELTVKLSEESLRQMGAQVNSALSGAGGGTPTGGGGGGVGGGGRGPTLGPNLPTTSDFRLAAANQRVLQPSPLFGQAAYFETLRAGGMYLNSIAPGTGNSLMTSALNAEAAFMNRAYQQRQAVVNRVNASWQAAEFAQFKQSESVAARVDRSWDAAALSQQKFEESAAARAEREKNSREMSWALGSFRAGRSRIEGAEADANRKEMSWALGSYRSARSQVAGEEAEAARIQRDADARESSWALRSFRRARAEVQGGIRERVANFQADIAGYGAGRQVREIDSFLAGNNDLDPMTIANLRRQRNTMRQKTPMAQFFGPPSAMGLYFQAMFGGFEVGRAFTATSDFNNPILNTSATQMMQTQSSAIGRMTGGIFGAAVMGTMSAVDMFGMGGSTAGAQRGFGMLGQYSPFAMQYAQHQAALGLSAMTAGTEVISAKYAAQNSAEALRVKAAITASPTSYGQQRATASLGELEYRNSFELRYNTLNQQGADAATAGDQQALVRVKAEFSKLFAEMKDGIPAMQAFTAAVKQSVDRAQNIATVSLQGRASVQRTLARSGPGAADVEALGQSLQESIDGALDELKSPARRLADDTISAYARTVNDANIQRSYETIATNAELRGENRSAAINRLAGARERAMNAARKGSFVTATGAIVTFDETGSIARGFAAQEALINQQFDASVNSANIAASGAQQVASAALSRNTVGAAAIGLANSTLAQFDSMRNGVDFEDFKRSELSGAASGFLKAGVTGLQTIKRDYLDAFRGQQLDLRLMDITNPRDTQDPTVVLKSIDEQIGELKDIISNLATN